MSMHRSATARPAAALGAVLLLSGASLALAHEDHGHRGEWRGAPAMRWSEARGPQGPAPGHWATPRYVAAPPPVYRQYRREPYFAAGYVHPYSRPYGPPPAYYAPRVAYMPPPAYAPPAAYEPAYYPAAPAYVAAPAYCRPSGALTVAGAVVGGVIGSQSARPGNQGLATVIGALTGGVLGSAVDQAVSCVR